MVAGQGGVGIDMRDRVVACFSDELLGADVAKVLEAAGYEVVASPSLPESVSVVGPDEFVVVVFDDADGNWRRHVADLLRERPRARPVVVADIGSADEFLAAISAGVAGFCDPCSDAQAIVRTVASVRNSGVAIPRRFVAPLVEHARRGRGRRVNSAGGPLDVTDREWEILQLLVQRRSTREMAGILYVSEGTVRTHVWTLLHKLGAVDREDAIAMLGPRHDPHERRSSPAAC